MAFQGLSEHEMLKTYVTVIQNETNVTIIEPNKVCNFQC